MFFVSLRPMQMFRILPILILVILLLILDNVGEQCSTITRIMVKCCTMLDGRYIQSRT